MEKLKPILLLCMFLAFIGTSCKKSSTNPTSAVSMSLKFNGTAKTSNTVAADYIKSTGTLQVIGKFGNEGLSLMITDIKVGTFAVGDIVIATYSTTADFQNTYLGSTGTVVISSFNSSTVTGTFSFAGTTVDGRNGTVTEGKFSAKVITQ